MNPLRKAETKMFKANAEDHRTPSQKKSDTFALLCGYSAGGVTTVIGTAIAYHLAKKKYNE